MSYIDILIKERNKFANLTSNLKLTGKTFGYDGFETAIRRAVLDLTARTLKPRVGVNGKLVEKLIDRNDSTSFINQVNDYFDDSSKTQEKFDDWHKGRCDEVLAKIRLHYTNSDGTDVCYGKAQKIVNITLKGCYCLDGADSKEKYFTHCHMALDSFTLSWYNRNHQEKIKTNWSNLSPDEYNTIMENVRAINDPIFGDLTPLQKEFLIWPLEIMITTVKGINNCFGGLVDGDHVTKYFETYDLSNDLMMANIILGLSKPEDLEEDFVKWLNKIPKSYNKSISAEFILTQFGKNISND